ncbi:MAG: hypothetical protein GY855_10050 [candidate division Zixibacteria bacterium]|nr:hypothetical protein [candidate division Zixibacteria bacterium]
MKVDLSANQVVSPRIIKSNKVNFPKPADSTKISSSAKSEDIRKAQFTDLLSDAEKDLIRDLFSVKGSDDGIKVGTAIAGSNQYGQSGKTETAADIQRTKGTIIDIVA